MLPKILVCDLNKSQERRIYEQLERRAAGRYEVIQLRKENETIPYDLIICPESKASFCQNTNSDAIILTWEKEFTLPITVSEIHHKIESCLDTLRQRQKSLSAGKKASMALVFCFDPILKEHWMTQYLRTLLGQGLVVLYLPIMPLYRVPNLEEKAIGPKLTDLLICLDQMETDISKDIGQYIFMHDLGYMTFRLSTASDDLISCPPHLLRKLLLLIREHINRLPDPVLAIIDCESICLDTAIRLTQLCDIFYADAAAAETGAGAVARRELAKYLAALPASVDFRIINEVKS